MGGPGHPEDRASGGGDTWRVGGRVSGGGLMGQEGSQDPGIKRGTRRWRVDERKTGDACQGASGRRQRRVKRWQRGGALGLQGKPQRPRTRFQSPGLGVLDMEGKWEMGKGCGRWKERDCS